jgi:hypothetical protein
MEMQIKDEGSIFLLDAGNEEAAEWLANHIDSDAIRWGSAYVVGHSYVDDIIAGFEADGGTVNVML